MVVPFLSAKVVGVLNQMGDDIVAAKKRLQMIHIGFDLESGSQESGLNLMGANGRMGSCAG